MHLAFDIGTHKIVGLVFRQSGDDIHVLESSFRRHPARSMRDGQIQDVQAVAELLRDMKEELQSATGLQFEGAFVAAAGRALKTSWGRSEEFHPQPVLFTESNRRLLEWQAVADAQARLLETMQPTEKMRGYYCVAHTVISEWLDEDRIGSLVGQRGNRFALDVLATFLPGAVVDSLETALRQAGLKMSGLTLEPIAALEAVMPPTMRHLNLALVDVGAGTSDIAITKEGTVCAYDMVPSAGDGITEALSKAYLLDFHVAELVKRQVSQGTSQEATNILGQTVTITQQEAEEAVRPAVRALASQLARAIREWNQKSPDAVLLVGGGSLTQGLSEELANVLEMPADRVAVRNRSAIRGVIGAEELNGPDSITPLGIVLRSIRGKETAPVRVRVDGKPVSLFQSERCTVLEALRAAGYPPEKIAGRMSPGITVTVNGEIVVMPGSRGQVARVWVNGKEASMNDALHSQDEIRVEAPEDGPPPVIRVSDVVQAWLEQGEESTRAIASDSSPRLCVNGTWHTLPRRIMKNGRQVTPDDPVTDRDELKVLAGYTVEEVASWAGFDLDQHDSDREGICYVNGVPHPLPATGWVCRRDGRELQRTEFVHDRDELQLEQRQAVTVASVLKHYPVNRSLRVTVNGQTLTLPSPRHITLNGAPAREDDAVLPGDQLQITSAWDEQHPTLHELLPHLGRTLEGLASTGGARRLILQVGGQPAGFTTPIHDGDQITIRWGSAVQTKESRGGLTP